MRIVHLIDSLDPDRGGPPLVVASLAAAQAASGHDVSIVSYGEPLREGSIREMLSRVPGIEKLRLENLPPLTRKEAMLASNARRLLPHIIDNCDVLHVHGVWEVVHKVATRLARCSGKPYVMRPCGALDPWSLRQKRLKKRIAWMFGSRAMYDRAAFTHALNADEAMLIRPLRLRSPVHIIPNGVFPEEFENLPQRGGFRRRHGLGDAPLILFLGRLHRKKGLDVLAEAFAVVARSNPDARLIVAGPDEGMQAEFVAQINRLGIADRVILAGPLYGSEKVAALVDADCFCLPSRQEGFSVAITESLACGTPVVISENCHFPEVAEAGAGIVLPLDAARFADAMTGILNDRAAANSMGEAGRRLVLSRYTWPAIADLTIERYRQAGAAATRA